MVKILTYLFCAASLLIPFFLIRYRGLLAGGRPIWLVVLLLVPCWMDFHVFTIRFDPRSLCAAAYLLGLLAQSYRERLPHGLCLSDLSIFLLVVVITISQFYWRSDVPLAPFDPFREFALPYLVGRFFIWSTRDIESILPAFCVCISLLAIYAIFEAVYKRNPIEIVFHGKPWVASETAAVGGEELDSLRWGLKRAFGTQTHPIALGLTFAMMLPWAIEAAVQSWQGRGPLWWRLVPFLALGGVVSTGSRGAQVCSLIVLGTIFFQAFRRLRPVVIIAVALGGVSFFAFRDDIVKWMEQYADEGKGADFVKINGDTYEYSGTLHRDLLFKVYEEGYDEAGWLGYGTMLRKVPRDPNMDKRFISIDNHYLMFYLQYGYLGMIIFGLLAVSILWNLLPPLLNAVGPPGRLAGGLFGAIGGCLIAMRTVWFAPDYSTVWLFCAGLTVGLAAMHRQTRVAGAPNLA